MSVRFEQNAYIEAVKEKRNLNSEEKIVNYAKNHQKFNYGNVTFRRFKDRHATKGWFGRKVIALPAIVWSGVVKTIYHLAKAILVGVIARLGDNKYLKAQFFYIARDLQESFGWLATLFSDKYGQYHIQESGFHKSCYDCFLADNIQPVNPKPGYTNSSDQPDYVEGELEKAHKIIGKLYSDTETKEAFIVKVAYDYIDQGNREKAIEVINRLYSDTEAKEKLLVQVAESYYVEGNRKKAIEVIVRLYSDMQTKEAFIVKVAYDYIDQGNREKAIEVINRLYSDTEAKEKLLVQVAESYYVEGELEKALQIIGKLYNDTETKEAFKVKVFNAYLKRGERDQAFKVINNISLDTQRKSALLIQIAQSYFSENDEAGVLQVIKEIACESLKNKMCESGNHIIYIEIMMENIGNNLTNDFFSDLAKDCLFLTRVYFTKNDAQSILKEIIRKSTDSLTVQAFLNLKTGQSHTRNESTRNSTSSNRGYSRPQNETRSEPSNPNASYYSMLELQPTASREDVKKAYKKLVLKYHPDKVHRNQNESEIEFEKRKQAYEDKYHLILEAYQILNVC